MEPTQNQNEQVEIKEGIAPHVIRQTWAQGRERAFLVFTTYRLHPFIVKDIPEEVIAGIGGLPETHELNVYESDAMKLKRGRILSKRRFSSEAEALKHHDDVLLTIAKGEMR